MSCIHYTYPLRCGDGRRPPRSVTFRWFSPFRGDSWSLRGDLSSAAGPRGDAFSSRGDDVLSPVALGLCSGSPPPPFSAGFPASSLKSNTNSSAFLPRFVAGAASSCSDRSRWFVFFSDGFSLGCAIGRDTRPAQRRARSCSEVARVLLYFLDQITEIALRYIFALVLSTGTVAVGPVPTVRVFQAGDQWTGSACRVAGSAVDSAAGGNEN